MEHGDDGDQARADIVEDTTLADTQPVGRMRLAAKRQWVGGGSRGVSAWWPRVVE